MQSRRYYYNNDYDNRRGRSPVRSERRDSRFSSRQSRYRSRSRSPASIADDILDCSLHSVEIHRADNDRFWQDSTYRAYGERLLADHPERRRDFRSSFRPRSRSPTGSSDISSLDCSLTRYRRRDRQRGGCEYRDQCEKLEILRKEHKDELKNLEMTHKAELLASKKELKEFYQEILDSKDECIASLRSEIKAKDEIIAFSKQRLNEIDDALSR